jgi:hypothetical protein
VVVGDDEHARTDPRARSGGSERFPGGERVAALTLDGEIGQLVDAEERPARDVSLEIRLPPGLDAVERVAAVDEAVLDQ